MMRQSFFIVVITLFLASCGGSQNDQLQAEVDSLRFELQNSLQVAQTLEEVGMLMDSIDANRQVLRLSMVEGTSYTDYTLRMRDLNNYVRDTEAKIDELESALKRSTTSANAFSATLQKLRADLAMRNDEIAALRESVEQLQSENQNLITTIGLQEVELEDKETMIMAKEQELAYLEQRMQQLMIQSKVSEADQYFARAQAVEEAANRTFFLAPKKKRETYEEALDLYKKSLSLGKTEAQEKISELEAKLQ